MEIKRDYRTGILKRRTPVSIRTAGQLSVDPGLILKKEKSCIKYYYQMRVFVRVGIIRFMAGMDV